MEQYVIKGGNPLVGEVEIGGAKNAALAILSAAIMTDETILIENLPDVRDINVLLEAIAGIGAQVEDVYKRQLLCQIHKGTLNLLITSVLCRITGDHYNIKISVKFFFI